MLKVRRFLRPGIFLRPLAGPIRDGHVLLLNVRIPCVGLRLLHADNLPEALDLAENPALHFGDILDNLEGEVELRGALRFVGSIVPNVQIAVFECLFDRDPRGRIECQHAVEQVERIGIGVREELLKGTLWHVGQVTHIFLGAGRADAGQSFFVWCAEDVENLVQLIDVVSALEERSATKKLCKNAANGPNINLPTLARAIVRYSVTYWLSYNSGSLT